MSIITDIQKLEPGDSVRLFALDTSNQGGPVLRFHNYNQAGPIFWKGQEYTPWALEARDFQRTGEVSQPSPTLSVGNIGVGPDGEPVAGVIASLCLAMDDLVGCVLTVRETLAKYLDPANFPDGNPNYDPSQELPLEVWFIEQKLSESPEVVEFELSTGLAFDGRQLPGRQIVATICPWKWIGGYRGPYCQYTGSAYFDGQDRPVSSPDQDNCAGLVRSCQLRFGAEQGVEPVAAVINFGGFPAADRVR